MSPYAKFVAILFTAVVAISSVAQAASIAYTGIAGVSKRSISGSGAATWHDFNRDNSLFASNPATYAYQSIYQCGFGLPGIRDFTQFAQVPAGSFNGDCYQCLRITANGKTTWARAAGTASRLEVGSEAKAILSPNSDTFTATWQQVADSECTSHGIDPWNRATCPQIAAGIYKSLVLTNGGGYCT